MVSELIPFFDGILGLLNIYTIKALEEFQISVRKFPLIVRNSDKSDCSIFVALSIRTLVDLLYGQ